MTLGDIMLAAVGKFKGFVACNGEFTCYYGF